MEKIVSLWITICFCSVATAQGTITYIGNGANSDRIACITEEVSYVSSEEGVSVFLKNGGRLLKKSLPDLPKMTAALIVDDHAKMRINILHESYEEIENVTVAPSKGNILRNIDPSALPITYGDAYSTDAFFPGVLAELSEAFIQNQFRGQSVQFYPVQYNPVTKVLRIYHSIEIEVTATAETGENPLPDLVPQGINPLMKDLYDSRFINYFENSDRYEHITELGNMLVISSSEYFDQLAPWIQWKKEKGINVTLVDVATVNSVTAINAFVANFYSVNGLTFLQLVGDESQVPSLLINTSGGEGYCDACYGYVSGTDHYAEFFVGRFLVHNATELKPVVDKILEYERTPYTVTDWFSSAMCIASNQGSGFGDEGEADWEHNNKIKTDLSGFTYTRVWEKYDGNHYASSPSGGETADESGNPTATGLSAIINDGCSLINYTGHGDHSAIVTGNFTNTNINMLANQHKYPYFIAVGCAVGDFDDDSGGGDTFGEAWIKSPDQLSPTGGIGGSFSSVLQSWAPPMEAQDEMNKLIAGTGSYATRHTIGSIHYHGCASMNDVYGPEGEEMTDAWIVMGDPSVQLRTAYPIQILASHPEQAFYNISSLTVTSSSENALVSLTLSGEIIATGLIQAGTCVLGFSPFTGPQNLLLTLTNFNSIPYQGIIQLVPLSGPFLIENSAELNDINGNNNGMAEYSEEIFVNIEVENIGIEAANNVVGVLSTTDPYVSILDGVHNFGSIDVSTVLFATSAFHFVVDNMIPDQHVVQFEVNYADDDGHTWSAFFSIKLNAPAFNCPLEIVITDDNGNGRLESGETATISISFSNTGHAPAAADAIVALSSGSPYIVVGTGPVNLGLLEEGAMATAVYSITVGSDVPEAQSTFFNFQLTSGDYSTECSFDEIMNEIIEDWETADIDQFDWELEGDSDWFVSSDNPFQGNYCLQSGDIANSESTTLKIVADFVNPGEVSFARRTSCESSYDYLRFRVNGLTLGTWSGERDWEVFTFPVSAGTQTLRWVYSKDNAASLGADAVWVDNIILPAYNSVGVTEEYESTNGVELFPNPFSNEIYVTLNLELPSVVVIQVLDNLGRLIQVNNKGAFPSGKRQMELDLSNLSPGVYFLQTKTDHGIFTNKLIKQ